MRGKVTDQDLTNYALNELGAEERLYVESMLGVSEECRHDVYRMLDLGEMLKEGFEVHEDAADLLLNHEQRDRVLTVPRFQWRGFLQRAAAIALLAAGVGYGLSKEEIWRRGSQIAAGAKQTIDNLGSQNLATSAEQFIAYSMKRATPAEPTDAQLDVANCTPPVMAADMMPMPDSGDM